MGQLYHGYVSHNQRLQFTDLKIFAAMPSAVAARDPSWNCLHMRIGASRSNGAGRIGKDWEMGQHRDF